jgi:hypothetical protein
MNYFSPKGHEMNFATHQALKALYSPTLVLIYLLRKLPLSWFFQGRLALDAVPRPYYAYCLLKAVEQAKRLGLSRISAIEFGVAAGHGLVVLERLAEQVTRESGVAIDVYGFDAEVGLPEPLDYRDLPYIWQKSFFKMDRVALTNRLKPDTRLILGDVAQTVPEFTKTDFAPIGFISFDLDFYSSTKAAMRIFEVADRGLLPRVFCYFDDIIGNDDEIMSQFVGELLAISEYNAEHEESKLDLLRGLRFNRIVPATWPSMVYVMHRFNHVQYSTYLFPEKERQYRPI